MLIFLGVCFGPRRHRVSLAIAIAIASSGYGYGYGYGYIYVCICSLEGVCPLSLSLSQADWALQFVYFTLSCPSLLYTHPTHPSSPLSQQVKHMVSPAEAATYAD